MVSRIIAKDLHFLSPKGPAGICGVFNGRHCTTRSDLEVSTHTGQVFEKDDYRNVRFTNAKRYVNQKWAINLVNEIPPKECTERVVYCDGGDGPLGHPRVYINLDQPGAHICVYCGLRFKKKEDHH